MVIEDEIESLINLDLFYQNKVKEAHDRKLNFEDEIKPTKEAMKAEYWDKVKAEVQAEKDRLNKEVADTVARNRAEFEEISSKLEKQFKENKENWLQDLFERTTSI